MCWGRLDGVDGLFEFGDEGVEDGGGGGVAEERGVEEVSALEDDAGVLLLYEVI